MMRYNMNNLKRVYSSLSISGTEMHVDESYLANLDL